MILDSRDINFAFHWLNLPDVLQRERFEACDMLDVQALCEASYNIAESDLASHLRASDLTEPQIDADGNVTVLPQVRDAVGTMAQAGLFATVFDTEDGGLQLPNIVHAALLGTLMAGNLSTASFPLLTIGNARLLCAYGSPAQKLAFAHPQIAGQAMGTMCLSEPHAGSSLGDIRTRAISEGEDAFGSRYRLSGNKMWISAGDHDATENIVHLVLAKVPDANGELPLGSSGITLFVVPKLLPDGQRNDVTVAGLNHKMGYRGIPNTALNFGEGKYLPGGLAGAIGWRIGAVGQGLPQMFHMMNDARMSVGLAGAMLACRGYQMSLAYARERTQGRVEGGEGPQVPIIAHADVRRMLLSQKAISQGALAVVLYTARLLDDERTGPSPEARKAASDRLALLTPVTKTWPSEWAQLSLHHALQIHGGAGYTRDFEIEQLFRDNRLNPIHEGTTGIQGIDLVGRKLRRDRGEAFAELATEIRSDIAAAGAHDQLREAASALGASLTAMESGVAALLAEADNRRALAHGTPALFAFGHLVIGWLWLSQAMTALKTKADGDEEPFDAAFLDGRVVAFRFFAETELPKVAVWLNPVVNGSDLVMSMPLDQF